MKTPELDAIDRNILELLQANGRMTNVEMARAVGLTPAPALERVRKLEKSGYIRGYAAIVDAKMLGYSTTAFVSVVMKSHTIESSARFRRECERIPEVIECHHIAGDEDFLLKVVARDPSDYERFVLETLTKVPGIEKIKTTFVLSSPKVTTRIPARLSSAETRRRKGGSS